jgi:predicted phage terminase large subunit-like protein
MTEVPLDLKEFTAENIHYIKQLPFYRYLKEQAQSEAFPALAERLLKPEQEFYATLVEEFGKDAAWILTDSELKRAGLRRPSFFVPKTASTGRLSELIWMLCCVLRDTEMEPPIEMKAEEISDELEEIRENVGLQGLLVARLGLFPDEFAARLFPHYIRLPYSLLHQYLLQQKMLYAYPFQQEREGKRLAIAAPRGAAKSTLVSLIFPLYDLFYEMEKYTVLVSATKEQARQRLAAIQRELRQNPRLEMLFKGYTGEDRKLYDARSQESFTLRGVRYDAKSVGTEMRGLNDGGWRPTHIIMDDVESSRCADSMKYRDKVKTWFREVIEPLGDLYTHISVVGTVLHPDSFLHYLLDRPDFESKKYASVMKWSNENTLWDKWKKIYNNRENRKRVSEAKKYFDSNYEEMMKDTQVLWSEKESYYQLMVQREQMGQDAFMQEKQNEPIISENQAFNEKEYKKFELLGDRVRLLKDSKAESKPQYTEYNLDELTFVGYLDSATGEAKKSGDDAAIAVMGFHPNGLYLLFHVWMKVAPVSAQIEQLFQLHERWGFHTFGFESNSFQVLLKDAIKDAAKKRGHQRGRTPFKLEWITNSANKGKRIAALEPGLSSHQVLLNESLSEQFLYQMRYYPNVDHDDGLDAVAGAWTLAQKLYKKFQPGRAVQRVKRGQHE